MHVERHIVPITTDVDQAATVYSPTITGRIAAIIYTKGDFTDGVDFTITLEATGQSLWTDTNINASETVYPVAPANLGSSGAASALTEAPILAALDRVKIVIGSGGVTKSGTITIVVA